MLKFVLKNQDTRFHLVKMLSKHESMRTPKFLRSADSKTAKQLNPKLVRNRGAPELITVTVRKIVVLIWILLFWGLCFVLRLCIVIVINQSQAPFVHRREASTKAIRKAVGTPIQFKGKQYSGIRQAYDATGVDRRAIKAAGV